MSGEAGAGGAGAGGEGGAGAGGAGTGGEGGAGAAAPWHGLPATDADGIAYVGTKGWQGPQDVITSYRNAEKLLGRPADQLLAMPRADDPAGLLAVFDKLGRPATPDKYEFSAPPAGVTPDAGYEAWARGTFHKVGLLPGQVKALTAEHNAYVANVMAQQQKDYELAVTNDKANLQTEWGGGFERMMASAKHAANTLGFKPEMIDAMEKSVGYAGTYKFFADLGKKMGESTFVSGDGKKPGFEGMMTPAESKAEWEAMKTDPIWGKALFDKSHPNHKAAVEKQQRLFALMYPAQ
jgi:hypothetical protein